MSKDALIICAHSDDQILGVGGTMAHLNDAGYNVHTFIMSYGELSHPHLEPSYIRDLRRQESEEADDIVGGDGVTFFDLPEGQFREHEHKAKKHIKRALESYNPDLVFTHSPDDFHGDHRATHDILIDTYDDLDTIDTDVYVFDIWTLWNIKKRDWPRCFIGIDTTYNKKIDALHEFTSQINLLSYTVLNNLIYVKQYMTGVANGLFTDNFTAEVFYKER